MYVCFSMQTEPTLSNSIQVSKISNSSDILDVLLKISPPPIYFYLLLDTFPLLGLSALYAFWKMYKFSNEMESTILQSSTRNHQYHSKSSPQRKRKFIGRKTAEEVCLSCLGNCICATCNEHQGSPQSPLAGLWHQRPYTIHEHWNKEC